MDYDINERYLRDQALEQQQKRILNDADKAIKAQESRLEAVLGGITNKREEMDEKNILRQQQYRKPCLSPMVSPPQRESFDFIDDSSLVKENNNNDNNNSKISKNIKSKTGDEIGPDAVIRLQRAKMKTMAEDLKSQKERIKSLEKQISQDKKSHALSKDDVSKLSKRCQSLELNREKEKDANTKLKERINELELDLSAAKRELKVFDKHVKKSENEGNSKDIRLHRALEEILNLKERLKSSQEDSNLNINNMEAELKRIRSDNTRLEKQKQDLLAAFKKQLKLIDVLKRQKIHLEAAKLLSFTEDEFTRTIETNHH